MRAGAQKRFDSKQKNRVFTVQMHHEHSVFYLTLTSRSSRREMAVSEESSRLYRERPVSEIIASGGSQPRSKKKHPQTFGIFSF